MVVKHSGACAANDCLRAREPPGMSWIDPAPRVGRIRRVCVEGNFRVGSPRVNEIDDLFKERHHRRKLPQAGTDNDTVEALRAERLLEPRAALVPKRKLEVKKGEKVSTSMSLVSVPAATGKAKATPSPSASETEDKMKARAAIKEMWRAKDEELKLKKALIENKIKNSTGAIREQRKYRLAVWQERIAAAKKDAAAARAAVK